MLAYLARHPGRLLSRNQIIEAIADHGEPKSDRSVDFLVNRVRRKLGDNARAPSFIETRYGGGYVWLGPAGPAISHEQAAALAIVGPLKGVDLLGADSRIGLAFARALAETLTGELGGPVVIVPEAEATGPPGLTSARFSVELSFFRQGEGAECVVAARSRLSGQVFCVTRQPLAHEGAPYLANARAAEVLGKTLLARRWQQEADHIARSEPVAVAMQNASFNEKTTEKSLQEVDPIIRGLRAEHPDDPAVALMYASHLHSRVISDGTKLFRDGPEPIRAIDAEIEALVQQALSWCQERPAQAILAAKLLYYVDPSYKALALELAETAHRTSTAIASSLTIFGQLRAFFGEIDAAIDLLRQAEALTAPKSVFRHYVQVLLCQALIAGGRRDDLVPVRAEVYRYHPAVRVLYEPVMTDPDHLSLRARGVMLALSRPRATAALRYWHHTSARLFALPEHRENTLRAPLNLFVRRFGRDAVPIEVKASVAALFC